MPIGLALIVKKLTLIVDIDSSWIMPIGLALIIFLLVSLLTLIADEIVSFGLALIVRDKISGFNIYSKVKLSCTWIDTGLRNPYGVGHLLHAKMGKGGGYRGLLCIIHTGTACSVYEFSCTVQSDNPVQVVNPARLCNKYAACQDHNVTFKDSLALVLSKQ